MKLINGMLRVSFSNLNYFAVLDETWNFHLPLSNTRLRAGRGSILIEREFSMEFSAGIKEERISPRSSLNEWNERRRVFAAKVRLPSRRDPTFYIFSRNERYPLSRGRQPRFSFFPFATMLWPFAAYFPLVTYFIQLTKKSPRLFKPFSTHFY